jgi:hypothetical protein
MTRDAGTTRDVSSGCCCEFTLVAAPAVGGTEACQAVRVGRHRRSGGDDARHHRDCDGVFCPAAQGRAGEARSIWTAIRPYSQSGRCPWYLGGRGAGPTDAVMPAGLPRSKGGAGAHPPTSGPWGAASAQPRRRPRPVAVWKPGIATLAPEAARTGKSTGEGGGLNPDQ